MLTHNQKRMNTVSAFYDIMKSGETGKTAAN